MKEPALARWGYLVEIIVAILFYWLLWILNIEGPARALLTESRGELLSVTLALLALSVAMFVSVRHSLQSDFGEWLHWRGALVTYLVSFGWAIGTFLVAALVLILLLKRTEVWAGRVGLIVLLYSAVGVYSVLKNTYDFTRLQLLFRHEKRKAEEIPDKPVKRKAKKK